MGKKGNPLLSAPVAAPVTFVDAAPVTFVLRILPRALRDFDATLVRLAEIEGDDAAGKWAEGFREFLASLATNPRHYCENSFSHDVLAPDAKGISGEVRNVTYRRDEGTAPYRLIYRIVESSQDGLSVRLPHIRHAAARSMTRKEAREIEAQSRE